MRYGHAKLSDSIRTCSMPKMCKRQDQILQTTPSQLMTLAIRQTITYAPDGLARLTLKDVLKMEQREQAVDVQS